MFEPVQVTTAPDGVQAPGSATEVSRARPLGIVSDADQPAPLSDGPWLVTLSVAVNESWPAIWFVVGTPVSATPRSATAITGTVLTTSSGAVSVPSSMPGVTLAS